MRRGEKGPELFPLRSDHDRPAYLALRMGQYIARIVFGRYEAQEQAVAAAIAQEAFHHVAYVAGTCETLLRPTASK